MLKSQTTDGCGTNLNSPGRFVVETKETFIYIEMSIVSRSPRKRPKIKIPRVLNYQVIVKLSIEEVSKVYVGVRKSVKNTTRVGKFLWGFRVIFKVQ